MLLQVQPLYLLFSLATLECTCICKRYILVLYIVLISYILIGFATDKKFIFTPNIRNRQEVFAPGLVLGFTGILETNATPAARSRKV